jgi:hypothetical protein
LIKQIGVNLIAERWSVGEDAFDENKNPATLRAFRGN